LQGRKGKKVEKNGAQDGSKDQSILILEKNFGNLKEVTGKHGK